MGIGRTLIYVGGALLALGLLLVVAEKLSIPLGRLPGDIVIRGKNSVFYFPIVTCIVLSVLLTLVMFLFQRR